MIARWRGTPKGPLTRFFLLNAAALGVYLHRIDRPDADREHHDHPWSFISIVLRGRYVEDRWHPRDGSWFVRRVTRGWLSVAFRRFSDAHRIVEVAPNTWTLIIRFRDRNTWGFYLAEGDWFRWIHWTDFVSRAAR